MKSFPKDHQFQAPTDVEVVRMWPAWARADMRYQAFGEPDVVHRTWDVADIGPDDVGRVRLRR